MATLPDPECPGLKPPETEVCVEQPSCGAEQVLADTVSIVRETLRGEQEGPELLPLLDSQKKVPDTAAPLEPSYTWKIAGFTTCTASCLGGLQESIVICVESRAENPVAPYFCDPHHRLEIEVRTCNENPCPPRWNVSDFSDCSKSCGGGLQTRSVTCIQEVRQDFRYCSFVWCLIRAYPRWPTEDTISFPSRWPPAPSHRPAPSSSAV